jgi:hypothetical protein
VAPRADASDCECAPDLTPALTLKLTLKLRARPCPRAVALSVAAMCAVVLSDKRAIVRGRCDSSLDFATVRLRDLELEIGYVLCEARCALSTPADNTVRPRRLPPLLLLLSLALSALTSLADTDACADVEDVVGAAAADILGHLLPLRCLLKSNPIPNKSSIMSACLPKFRIATTSLPRG